MRLYSDPEACMASNNEDIARYEQENCEAKKIISNNQLKMNHINKLILNYFNSWGVSDLKSCDPSQRKIISNLNCQIGDLKKNNVFLDNSIFSNYLSMFNLAIDNCYLSNASMLSIFKDA